MLRTCLESLARQDFPSFEIIVVDNGSSDSTVDMLIERFPAVRLIRFDSNQGFAPAVNAGIRDAVGDIIVLLNNDAEADPGFIAAFVAALDRRPDVAACAARVLLAGSSGRIDSLGIRMGLFPSQVAHGDQDGPAFQRPGEVFAPSGGAAAYRRSALVEVGALDDRFFAYFEDADLGCRLRLAGYRCLYVPDAVAWHRGSATARRVPELKFYLLMRNGLFVFFQNMPMRRILPWAPLVLVWPLFRSVLDGVRLRVALRAIIDFLRDFPAVAESRRRAHGLRRIPWPEFMRTLSHPLTRSRESLLPRSDR